MTQEQIISWIFYAVALASDGKFISRHDICSVADGINHAWPTDAELKLSFRWLKSKGWIEQNGRSFCVTEFGQTIIDRVSSRRRTIFAVWKDLSVQVAQAIARDV